MMQNLTSPQRRAARDAFRLLQAAKISPETLVELQDASELENSPDTIDSPSVTFLKATRTPQKAQFFTASQQLDSICRVTRKRRVAAIVYHPEGSVVEYLETGRRTGESVAHVFDIDPRRENANNPRMNIQHSLGGTHGAQDSISCNLLRDPDSGKPLKCKRESYSCEYLVTILIMQH